MRVFFRVMIVVAVCLLSGCVSSRDRDMARLLESLKDTAPSEYIGPDEPEPPVSVLPPMPATELRAMHTDITIQPDCLLLITVQEDPELNGTYPVNDIGAIQLGYIGPVILFNKTEDEAEEKIRDILKLRNFRNATVDVRIQRASYDKVMITGDVHRPGMIRLGAGDSISMNDALLQAGGLKADAAATQLRVVKGGLLSAVRSSLDGQEYTMVTEDGIPRVPELNLRNNDVVYVFSSTSSGPGALGSEGAGKSVLVLGEVHREGFYSFGPAEQCSMLYLLLKMGGLPAYANDKSVRILRRDEYGHEEEIKVDARRILRDGNPDFDVSLENGDRIIVPPRRINLF